MISRQKKRVNSEILKNTGNTGHLQKYRILQDKQKNTGHYRKYRTATWTALEL